jgi:predicted aspartyl protease
VCASCRGTKEPELVALPDVRLPQLLLALLAVTLAACEPPEPLVPDRSYLYRRNAVDASKPCLIAKFAGVPVKLVRNSAFVPVKVNSTLTYGMIDTGSDMSMLSPDLAAAANLHADPHQPRRRGYGLAGGFDLVYVQPDKIQIGGLIRYHPTPANIVNFAGHGSNVGALIGSNLLDGFDWDIDFPHDRMTAVRTSNCHDIDPPWDTKSSELPLTRGTNRQITEIASMLGLAVNVTLPVEFDGGSLKAVFDTGARMSYLTREGAHKAGITNTQLDHDPTINIGAINGKIIKARLHRVNEFVVGQDLQKDFPVAVAEHLNRDDEFDMILGMDWIARHHVWLSYTTDSLYVDSGEKKPLLWKPAPKLDF